jgi:tetratricopeptide (TPR) repeat protein
MLETVQQYALEKLEASGRLKACRSVHQLYFLEIAEYADREAWEQDKQAESSEMLVENLHNLRLALRGLTDERRADESLRLAGALGGRARWTYAGASVWETAEWLDQAWALKDQATPGPRARAALALGVVRWKQGNLAEGRARALESLKIYRDLGQDFHVAWSLGIAAFCAEDPREAREEMEEALGIARRLGHKMATSAMLNSLGELERAEGNCGAAEGYYLDSLVLARETGYRFGEATALGNLGSLAYARQDWVRARELYEQELTFWLASIDEWFFAMSMSGFASLLFHEGEHTPAARLQGFADALCRKIGVALQPLELEDFEATAAALKHELGEAAYQEAFETGKALTRDQAVDIALRRG